jgi:YcxB-like protein
MEDTLFTISFKPTFWMRYCATMTLAHSRKSIWFSYALIVILPTIGLINAGIMKCDLSQKPFFNIPLWVLLILIYILIFISIPLTIMFSAYLSGRGNKAIKRHVTETFTKDGISIDTDVSNVKFKWEAFCKAKETKKFFIYFISSSNGYYIPKAMVSSPADIEKIRHILLTHMGDKALLKN